MAPRRAAALVLVVDVGGRPERLLEAMGSEQRRGSVERIGLPDGLRDLDLALGTDLLADECHREQRGEVVRTDRLAGARVEHRVRRRRQVGRDVVPGARDPVLVEDELRPIGDHRALLLLRGDREGSRCPRARCVHANHRSAAIVGGRRHAREWTRVEKHDAPPRDLVLSGPTARSECDGILDKRARCRPRPLLPGGPASSHPSPGVRSSTPGLGPRAIQRPSASCRILFAPRWVGAAYPWRVTHVPAIHDTPA